MADSHAANLLGRLSNLEQQAASLREELEVLHDQLLASEDADGEAWTRMALIDGVTTVITALEQLSGSTLMLRPLADYEASQGNFDLG